MSTAEHVRPGYRRNASAAAPGICGTLVCGNIWLPVVAPIIRQGNREIERPVYEVDG
ncbi:MAG: hypothetical protein OEN02_09770 [Gammaproteobacteria bacterium]|nr:hypothetical protein [Gammaproteobacteria bacterium]MDH3535864.1 hypothetical protein [Gammaproteobacteria bacterium]